MFILQMPPAQPTAPRPLILPGTIGGTDGMFNFRPRTTTTTTTAPTTTITPPTTTRPPRVLMTDASGGMQSALRGLGRLISSIFD